MRNHKNLKSLLLVTVLSGCSFFPFWEDEDPSKDNKEYENIANADIDAAYTFSSNLQKESKIYPLSTGRSFYVSNLGSEDNDGLSANTPIRFRDIKSLNLIPGDSVLFQCGETYSGSLTLSELKGDDDNPITFASYGEGEKPIITARSDVLTFKKSSNVVVRDLHIKVEGLDRMQYPNNLRNGILFLYDNVGTLKSRNIYICDNVVEGNGVSYNLMGITIQGEERTHASSPSEVLTNCYINGNEVFNVGRSGIRCSGWVYNDNVNNNQGKLDYYKNFHVDNNVVYNVGCMGIYVVACTDSTMNRNLIHDTGLYDQNQLMEGECGIMALSTKNCDIMFNEIYNIYDAKTGYDSMAIDIDWNTYNVNVQYNNVYDILFIFV